MGNQINGININQALQVAAQAVNVIRGQQGLAAGNPNINLGNLGQATGAFQNLAPQLPNIGNIPGGQAFARDPGPLAGINSTIVGLQKKYSLKIAGSEKGTSAENLAAILNSGNQPLTPAQAKAQDFAWLEGYNKAERARRADPANNPDAEEIDKLQADIDEIKKRQTEDSK